MRVVKIVIIAPKDYIADITAMSQLLPEVIYKNY